MLTAQLQAAAVKLAEHETPGPYYFILPLDANEELLAEAKQAGKFLGEVKEGLLYRLHR